MKYLVIGHSSDLCARRLVRTLREHSHEVLFGFDVLAGQTLFSWELSTQQSSSTLTLGPSETIRGEALDGVFVRAQGGPQSAEGWTKEDWAYVQAEGQAALLAWLASLPCPVVNRPTADLWFRPYRPYPEWRTLFRQSGLLTLAAQITNDLSHAREFSRICGGIVAYTPLTSNTSYPIRDDTDWNEVAKLLKVFPLCLVESRAAAYNLAWRIGPRVIWATRPDFDESARVAFERGIENLAARLGLATFEVQVTSGKNGPCCAGINLYPRLEQYDEPAQDAIVSGLVSLLGAAS